jgi:hypothetical protein
VGSARGFRPGALCPRGPRGAGAGAHVADIWSQSAAA